MAGLLTIDRAISVEHGAETVSACRVKNTGTLVDQFSVQVLGPAAAWTVAEPASISLFPGADGVINLRFKPPDSVKAGSVPVGIKLNSATEPAAAVVEETTLAVGAFVQVTARIVPRVAKGRGGGKHKLVIKNTGNSPTRVRVNGSDPDELIRFRGLGGTPIALAAGERHEVRIRYRSTASHMTGPAENHQFTISVVPEGGEPVPVQGSLLQKAAISGWMIAAVGLFVAFIAVVLLLKSLNKSALVSSATQAGALAQATPTPSASAKATPTPGAGTPTPAAGAGGAGGAGGAAGSGGSGGAAGSGGSGGTGGTAPQKLGGGGGPVILPGGGPTSAPTSAATAAPTPFPFVSNGLVTFTRNDNQIFVQGSGGPVALAGAPANAIAGRWSPDGRSMLYYLNGAVDVASFNGSTTSPALGGAHQVASGCSCWAGFTPDGASITYLTAGTSGENLMIVPVSGGTATALVQNAPISTSGWMAWTPDERFLLFSTGSTGFGGCANGGIFAEPKAGGSPVVVSCIVADGLAVKSDGSRIAWTSGGNLFVASFNSSLQITNIHQASLPSGTSGAQYAAFDRTGNFVYFTCSAGTCASSLASGAPSKVSGTAAGDLWPDA